MLKNTGVAVIEKKMIICNRVVQLWDEEVKEAMRVRREVHGRYATSETTVEWKEYAQLERTSFPI